jgi:hypothetical protein
MQCYVIARIASSDSRAIQLDSPRILLKQNSGNDEAKAQRGKG